MRLVITGGGTGGHIYPALAVALKLKKRGWEILYMGSANSLEENIALEWDLDFKAVDVAPLKRKITPKILSTIITNIKGIYQSRKIIKNFKSDVVFGTGGFVAGPVVLAGYLSSIPTIIHEQNVYPGLTNRLLSKVVNKIALNFIDAQKYFSNRVRDKITLTGNPVRDIILKTKKSEGIKYFNFSSKKKTILIFGGSQGSRSINEAVYDLYPFIIDSNDLQLIHITGKNNFKSYTKFLKNKGINYKKAANIKVMPYLKHMEYAYAITDLVIGRAGATGISEITAKGLASILIPYPFATGNHQMYNAKNLENHGAAELIKESELNSERILDRLKNIIYDQDLLMNMKKRSLELGHTDSTEKIIKEIKNLL